MGSVKSYIDNTATAARYFRLLNKSGLAVQQARPLSGMQKAGYFVLGLGYHLIDVLRPLGPHLSLDQTKKLPVAVTPEGFAWPVPAEIKVTSNGIYTVSNKAGLGGASGKVGDSRGRVLIPKHKLHEEVIALASEKTFFTKEEVARYLEENFGSDYRAPLTRIEKLLAELVGEKELRQTGKFYHLKTIDPAVENQQFMIARHRVDRSFWQFKKSIDSRVKQLQTCDNAESLWNIIHDDRVNLGFRGVYLFFKINGLKQIRYTSDRELSYREKAEEPMGVMRQVLAGDQTLYRVAIGEDLDSSVKNFRAKGIKEIDAQWVKESLLEHGIESIDLLKLSNEKGQPVGVLLLRDPVYFGEENQVEVDGELLKLSSAIGQALSRLVEKEKAGQKSAAEILDIPPLPLSQRRYLNDSRLIQIVRKNAQGSPVKLSLELIKDPYRFLADHSDEIVADLSRIFAAGWQPLMGQKMDTTFLKEYIFNNYWKRAEKMIVVRDQEGKTVGFAVITREMVDGKNVFCLRGTDLEPAFQEMRLSVMMNQILLTETLQENGHRNGGKIKCAVLTANPRVVGSISIGEGVFPNPFDPEKGAGPDGLKINKTLAQRWVPGAEYEEKYSIVRGALKKGVGGILYRREEVQLHRDPKINGFCLNNLNYENGDLLLFSGDFSKKVIYRAAVKKIVRGVAAWWQRLWLDFRRLFYR